MKASLKELLIHILGVDFRYPVGSYYETSNANFNPNNSWGGTWILETEGMVHVSGGSNYPVSKANDNNGAGAKDGGETTHILSEQELPSHAHTYHKTNGSGANSYHAQDYYYIQYGSSTWPSVYYETVNTSSTGQNKGHNNMQPYINIYRWHRTA